MLFKIIRESTKYEPEVAKPLPSSSQLKVIVGSDQNRVRSGFASIWGTNRIEVREIDPNDINRSRSNLSCKTFVNDDINRARILVSDSTKDKGVRLSRLVWRQDVDTSQRI